MRVWIDLANSPHVPLLEPVVRELRDDGHDVLLTLRPHAQTVALAEAAGLEGVVVGRQSPAGMIRKGAAIADRARELRRVAGRARTEVAFAHGSYAQALAALTLRVPVVTMMDYEHQPANHLTFRIARVVVLPEAFPEDAARRAGARRIVRYPGFKEQLYLEGLTPDRSVLAALGVGQRTLVAMRPPPEGAVYHRQANPRFDEVLGHALAADGVDVVLMPRDDAQRERYGASGAKIPEHAIDARSLAALADLVVGAGGTMNREGAVLGTPTYTVFAGRLAAVDAALMELGRLRDLREPGTYPELVPKADPVPLTGGAAEIRRRVVEAILSV